MGDNMIKECAHEIVEYTSDTCGVVDFTCRECGYVIVQFEDCGGGR